MKKKELPLYVNNGKKIYPNDILRCLRDLGVKNGDCIMVHSDLSVFGKLSNDFQGKSDKFLKAILKVFKEVVGGNGNLLMPVYTYSFLRGEVYDTEKSLSTAGVLTEYFRKQKNVLRNEDPNISFAIWGKDNRFFTENLGNNSFGANSVFEKLYEKKAKIILFGAPFQGGTTFVHYIENQYGVSYRYKKLYYGKILDGEKSYKKIWEHDARFQDKYVSMDCNKLIPELKNNGILRESVLGNGLIRIVDAEKYFEWGIRALEDNERIFISPEFFSRKNDFSFLKDDKKFINKLNKEILERTAKRPELEKDILGIPEKYFSSGIYREIASRQPPGGNNKYQNFGQIFLPGLDKREFIFLFESLSKINNQHDIFSPLIVGIWLAGRLREMQIQLKYSYRLIFLPPGNSAGAMSYFKKQYPKINNLFLISQKSLANIKNNKVVLQKYLDRVYFIEYDGIFLKQKLNFRPRMKIFSWSDWLKKQKISNKQKKEIELIYESCDGKVSLAKISKITRIDFKEIRKKVNFILKAGFLKEVNYINSGRVKKHQFKF